MKHISTFIILYSLFSAPLWSQVGIGTTAPQETLDINGTLRVEGSDDTNEATGLIGADNDGTLTTLNIDSSLTLINNTLELTRSYIYDIGIVDISGAPVISGELPDLDLLIGPGDVNEGKTVIYVINTPSNVKLTGIQDGVNGLHIFFYHFDATNNIQFLNEDSGGNTSVLTNRIKVLTNSETISGKGCVELIYDGNSERWLFLSVHD